MTTLKLVKGERMSKAAPRFKLVIMTVCALFSLFSAISADTNEVQLSTHLYKLPYQWQRRSTALYDATLKQLFVGSTASDAGSALIISTINNQQIYSHTPRNLATASHVDSAGYDKRPVWDMALIHKGAVPWLTATMTDTTNQRSASSIHFINVSDPAAVPTYFTHTSVKNSLDETSIPHKLAGVARATSISEGDRKVFVMAVRHTSTADNFSSEGTGSCFRLFTVNGSGNGLTEFTTDAKLDVDSASYTDADSEKKIGKISDIRDMYWDSTLERLYCAVHRTAGHNRFGVYSLFLKDSTTAAPKIRSLKQELLSTQESLCPYVHKVRTLCTNPTDSVATQKRYLIINGSTDASVYNTIYALPIVNKNDPTNTDQGRIATKADSNLKAVTNNDSWFDQSDDTANATYLALRMVGGRALPVEPQTPVTNIQTSKGTVYVTTANKDGSPSIFSSTATVDENDKITGWSVWKEITDANFTKPFVTSGVNIETGNNKFLGITQSGALIHRPTTNFPAFTNPLPMPLSVHTTTNHWRQRTLTIPVLGSSAITLHHASAEKSMGGNGLVGYTSTDSAPLPISIFSTDNKPSQLYDKAIWDMTVEPSTKKLVVIPHTTIDGPTIVTGGSEIYYISGSNAYGFGTNATTTTAPLDNLGTASRFYKVTAISKPYDDGGTTKYKAAFFAAIPANNQNLFTSGQENCIRTLELHTTSTEGSWLREVPGSFKYDFKTITAYSGQGGGNLSFKNLQDMCWDPILKKCYIGFSKDQDGNGLTESRDPGLVMIGFDANGENRVDPKKLLEKNTGYKHILKMRVMHTKTDTTTPSKNRSYLIFNGSNHINIAGNSSGQTAMITNRLYALPLVVTGDNTGKIATDGTCATATTDAESTWRTGVDDSQHIVGGSALPTHNKAVIRDMVVSGKSVMVSVVNPPGIEGQCGIFITQAITDENETLVRWTPWKPLADIHGTSAGFGYLPVQDKLISLHQNSGEVKNYRWQRDIGTEARFATDSISYSLRAFESDIDNAKGGIYEIWDLSTTSTTAGTSYMMGATGFDSFAIAHFGLQTTSSPATPHYPSADDKDYYKVFKDDAVIKAVGPLYTANASPGKNGWIFVGGYAGCAVLRTPGSGATAGVGWTEVPLSLADTNSDAHAALNAMTWKQVPGITSSVYKIITTDSFFVGMTKKGLVGFKTTAGKFKDSVPDALGSFSYTFPDDDEYMRDVVVVHGKELLIGTTKGLYYLSINDSEESFITPTPIYYKGKLFGPIGTIHVTKPATEQTEGWFNIDVLTARLIDDQSAHYTFKIKLSTGTISNGTVTSPILVRGFFHLLGKIYNTGPALYYTLPGKHLTTSGSIGIISSEAESSTSCHTVHSNTNHIGSITEFGADGTRIVVSGGNVYTYR
jgi:hypothetical protein